MVDNLIEEGPMGEDRNDVLDFDGNLLQ